MSMKEIQVRDEAVLPQGFRASGLHAGIKKNGRSDIALLLSDQPAAVAGVFTTNQVSAAPVKWCRERLSGGVARAIIVNSGNANACTGAEGLRDARRMAELTAELLGVEAQTVFVCSTGKIGVPLPMDRVEGGIHDAVEHAAADGAERAAHAILTTDTCPKHLAAELAVDGKKITVSAMAKGAGMIHPHMATMLCFILTDARVAREALQSCLNAAVSRSFNRISVDGDRSTNDTVLALANGAAGNEPLQPAHPDWALFEDTVNAVAHGLALKIVSDAEGATKLVTVKVKGARNDSDADAAARSVANSIEVKASWHGTTAGWGRVMDALGYSPAQLVEEKVDIFYDEVPAVAGGTDAATPADQLSAVVSKPYFTVAIDLHLGEGEAVMYSCDCSEEYIRMNIY